MGLILTVESLEEAAVVDIGSFFIGVLYHEPDGLPFLQCVEGNADCALIVTVLKGIVHKKRGELADFALIGLHAHIGSDGELQVFFFLLREGTVWIDRFLHAFGNVNFRQLRAVLPFSRAGDHDQVLDQAIEPFNLAHG